MKERISLTLDRDLVRRVDGMVNHREVKNRSHAIELLIAKAFGLHIPRVAIILAGGKGTRLRPLTYEIPKVLIPVQNRALTEHVLDLFKRHGVQEIIFAVGHMKEKIKEHLGDGSKFGVRISYLEEDEPLGTAGPIRLCSDRLQDTFIVSNGDELKDIDLEEMYQFHKQSKALVTIALTTVTDPSAYGVAKLSGNRILEFVEKPEAGKAPSNLINSGLYMIEPEIIDMIPEGFAMFEKEVFPKLAKQGKLFGYPFSGQWFDTGNMERYERAIKEWRGIRQK